MPKNTQKWMFSLVESPFLLRKKIPMAWGRPQEIANYQKMDQFPMQCYINDNDKIMEKRPTFNQMFEVDPR